MNTSGSRFSGLWKTEDWWAVWLGLIIFALTPLVSEIPKPGVWTANPLDSITPEMVTPLVLLLLGAAAVMALAVAAMRQKPLGFASAFPVIFAIAVISFVVSSQATIKAYGLGYAFWALLVGLLISNTVGTPKRLMPAVRTELYIKVGLVLLGGEILFTKMLALGGPGLLVAWVVTPIVVTFMYFFGIRTLKMSSKKLTIIVAAATSVCGVSAAIAVAGACKAKKAQLTLAVGMTLIFTVRSLDGRHYRRDGRGCCGRGDAGR